MVIAQTWNFLSGIKGRCLFLVISLVTLLCVYPTVSRGPHEAVVMMLLNSATLLAGVYAVSERRVKLIIATAIAVPQFLAAITALGLPVESPLLPIVRNVHAILLVAFYCYTLIVVLDYVMRWRCVTLDRVYGGLSVYLLLGLTWASVYSHLVQRNPESFLVNYGRWDAMYFSFVTLTTLGYGDIVPISPGARTMASLEAISGVMCLAILIARLVATYRPHDNN